MRRPLELGLARGLADRVGGERGRHREGGGKQARDQGLGTGVDVHGITSEPLLDAPGWRGRDSAIGIVIGIGSHGTSAKIRVTGSGCQDCPACLDCHLATG
jgi:hypothetical protein